MIQPSRFLLALTVASTLVACGSDADSTPAKPSLGQQIDRIGRPAISTLFVGVLEDAPEDRDAAFAKLNEAPDLDHVKALFHTEEVAVDVLGVFDALDGEVPMSGEERCEVLRVLADDRIQIDSRFGDCKNYLAVELERDGCGGHMPGHDVVDATLSWLAGNKATGVFDGVEADGDGVPPAVFPFLRPAS